MRYVVTRSSWIPATPAEAWAHATSIAGINRELMPALAMSAPEGMDRLPDELPPEVLGQRLWQSRILAFGRVPIDRHDVTLVELEPGHRFLERSPLGSMRLWQHERVIAAEGAGTRVSDTVTFEPRFAGAFTHWCVRALFALRHRNLGRAFSRGSASA